MVLQNISIAVEASIAVLGILIALRRKKIYGWGIFMTFFIYGVYDFAKLTNLSVSEIILEGSFFIATISALWVVYSIYKEGRKK